MSAAHFVVRCSLVPALQPPHKAVKGYSSSRFPGSESPGNAAPQCSTYTVVSRSAQHKCNIVYLVRQQQPCMHSKQPSHAHHNSLPQQPSTDTALLLHHPRPPQPRHPCITLLTHATPNHIRSHSVIKRSGLLLLISSCPPLALVQEGWIRTPST